ncbi:MAG: apolipoprotein N-acyltransferase, partial [Gammaproteobacteria bacterium]
MTTLADQCIRGRCLAGLLGLVFPVAFAPAHAWPVALLVPALLFVLWDGQSSREAAWRGFCFGFAAFAAGTYWLYISIRGFGGAPMPIVVLLMFSGFCLMGLYLSLAGFLAARLPVRSCALRFCFVWPAAFTFVEWLRTWLFLGFPWLSIGYGQIDGPLRAWAPLAGVHGVTLVTVVLSGAALTLLRGGRSDRRVAGLTIAAIVVATAALQERDWTAPAGQTLRVSLLQGSIPQDRKWLREQLRPTLRLYR